MSRPNQIESDCVEIVCSNQISNFQFQELNGIHLYKYIQAMPDILRQKSVLNFQMPNNNELFRKRVSSSSTLSSSDQRI